MQVKLSQAVKMFFGNSSLEMVFFEAIANALDANSSEINISITASALSNPETLRIQISDNGNGFTKERYQKFSKLFDVDESSHKGLGRLVYLCYFDDVKVESYFDKTNKIEFSFNTDFDGAAFSPNVVDERESGTILKMSGYTLSRIAKNEYISAVYLKKRLLEEFYSRLFQLKEDGVSVKIKINTMIAGENKEAVVDGLDIPTFTSVELDSSVNLIDKFLLHYSIRKVDPSNTSLIAAISVDNRTVKVDIVAEEYIPIGYDMVFLLYSQYFDGKIDATRQSLTISKSELREVQAIFRKKVSSLIEEHIPTIKKRNETTKSSLMNMFPHLSGFFDVDNIGYVSRNEILKKAQDIFFSSQKILLEANGLSDDQFDLALDVSSRALTEYVLFRQLTIDKLKASTKDNSEDELHTLFATRRKKGKFEKNNLADDLYRNNAWLLDDKYMTYETVLSDREFGELISYITSEDTERDDDRVDISLVFSNKPDGDKPFDVVIVELKKRGISLEENMKVITQLEKRARKLMQFYKNKIQRIWYYGIIEINEDVELALSGEYTELYSTGKMFYKETNIAISLTPKIILPIGVFIWDLDAVVNDACSRNSAFLNLLKSKFVIK